MQYQNYLGVKISSSRTLKEEVKVKAIKGAQQLKGAHNIILYKDLYNFI